MDAVMRWCCDWKAAPGTAAGKTETNTFRCNSLDAAAGPPNIVYATPFSGSGGASEPAGPDANSPWALPPWKVELAVTKAVNTAAVLHPLRVPPRVSLALPCAINESDSYRYLGLRMHVDLTDRLATKHLI